jgi:RNA polymerase sigma-70 factor (ECF subfamily)
LEKHAEDHSLVIRARDNGPEAFGPIVVRYQHAVFGIALSRLGNSGDAEDTAQQVFIEAYQRLDQLKNPDRLGAWLRSITVHRCIDLLRRRKDSVSLESAGELTHPGPSPQETMEKNQLRERVMNAIAGLSRKQRETVTLFYINGYSIKDIAAMQEAPVGSIKRRLHDARGRLKEEMLDMVEDTLKAEAPKEDFAKQVFDILNRYGTPQPEWPWPEIEAKLKELGVDGIEGFTRAMATPHSPTRQFAVHMLGTVYESTDAADKRRERFIEMLKQGLRDSNKGVRSLCAIHILDLKMDEGRKIEEVVPLVVPLLRDRAKKVRWRVAYELQNYAKYIPLEPVALALADETDPNSRGSIAWLVRAVVEGRTEKYF